MFVQCNGLPNKHLAWSKYAYLYALPRIPQDNPLICAQSNAKAQNYVRQEMLHILHQYVANVSKYTPP